LTEKALNLWPDRIKSEDDAAAGLSWPAFLKWAAGFLLVIFLLDYGICAFLDVGLRRYFGLDKPAQVVFVGHSRTILGIDDALLGRALGVKAAKFAVNGANTVDRAAMVRFFLTQQPDVKVLVYDVEASSFAGEGLSANSYRLFFPFIGDPGMAAYLKGQCKSLDEYWLRKIWRTSRYDEVTLSLAMRGWLGVRENLKLQAFNPALARRAVEKGRSRPVSVEAAAYRTFLSTIAFARARGVKVALVNLPTVDILNRIDAEKREQVRELFRKLAREDPDVVFLDYSRAFETRYDLFYDTIHMNAKGQRLVTEELAKRLKGVLQ